MKDERATPSIDSLHRFRVINSEGHECARPCHATHQILLRSEPMHSRIDFRKASPAAVKTMFDMEAYLARSSIERPLLHLVKMRASQINGCAYCHAA
jgi:hypothetical protein